MHGFRPKYPQANRVYLRNSHISIPLHSQSVLNTSQTALIGSTSQLPVMSSITKPATKTARTWRSPTAATWSPRPPSTTPHSAATTRSSSAHSASVSSSTRPRQSAPKNPLVPRNWTKTCNGKVIEINYITNCIWLCDFPFLNVIGNVIESKKSNEINYITFI